MTNTPAALIAHLRSLAAQETGDRADHADSIIDDIEDADKEGDENYDFLLSYPPLLLRVWFDQEITAADADY